MLKPFLKALAFLPLFVTTTLLAQKQYPLNRLPSPEELESSYLERRQLFPEKVVEAAGLLSSFDTTSVRLIKESWYGEDYIPYITNDQIQEGLAKLETEVPLNYNSRIRPFVDFFGVDRREYTLRVMQRINLYFPLFEKILAEYDMPDELKYLSIIESALIPNARSWVGAQGLWQFMPGTGRMFGLKINYYVDERMDPEKSTRAACKYLRNLHDTFGDWELAIAAYNCGPGNVRKAQRRTGKYHFWDIYQRLPRETRSYLPQYVAMIYVLNHAEDLNLIQEQPFYPIPASEVYVSQSVDLKKLADELSVCEDDLKQLNPELRKGIVPSYAKNYPLKIPGMRLLQFNAYREDILAKVKYSRPTHYSRETGEYYYHIVSRGENLGLIAQRNGVGLSKLRAWNNLYHNRIHPGQKLKIYSANGKPRKSVSKSKSSYAEVKNKVKNTPSGKIYTVRSGDTLWEIARKFDGMTVQKIKSMNNLRSNQLKPGQKLKVG